MTNLETKKIPEGARPSRETRSALWSDLIVSGCSNDDKCFFVEVES